MPYFDDPDAAAEAGRKSAEVRRRRKEPDKKARKALLDGAAEAAQTLVAVVSAGEGFEDVKPELRFKAALVVLEYVLGKPAGIMPEGDEKPSDPETNPFEALLKQES